MASRTAHDLPSTVPHDDESPLLSMVGRSRGISRNHLLQFAAAVGLPARVAACVLDDVLLRLEGLEQAHRFVASHPPLTLDAVGLAGCGVRSQLWVFIGKPPVLLPATQRAGPVVLGEEGGLSQKVSGVGGSCHMSLVECNACST